MRLSALPVLLAGVGLAQQVASSPIRVVVVTSHQEVSSNASLGDSRAPAVAQMLTTTTEFSRPDHMLSPNNLGAGRPHHGCGSLRDKALKLSNKFREALGFPAIEIHPAFAPPFPPPPVSEGEVHILPFIGTPPPSFVGATVAPVDHVGGFHHAAPDGMVQFHHHHHVHHGTFLIRVHRALMSLGPWEGRAVAFVLGCGIGVLLRMLYVLALVSFRVCRGATNNGEDDEYDPTQEDVIFYEGAVLFDAADAEHILVPPPQYTDEKVALAEADKKSTDN